MFSVGLILHWPFHTYILLNQEIGLNYTLCTQVDEQRIVKFYCVNFDNNHHHHVTIFNGVKLSPTFYSLSLLLGKNDDNIVIYILYKLFS